MRRSERLEIFVIFVDTMGDSAKVNVQEQIKEQGEVVRRLKAAKAPKEQVKFFLSRMLVGVKLGILLEQYCIIFQRSFRP